MLGKPVIRADLFCVSGELPAALDWNVLRTRIRVELILRKLAESASEAELLDA